MKNYANIVFLQGWEAEEPLALLDQDPLMCLAYLKQWDFGEYHEMSDTSGAGSNDRRISLEDYHIIYNASIGYIGLEKIINT